MFAFILMAFVIGTMPVWMKWLPKLAKIIRRFRGTPMILILSLSPWFAAPWLHPSRAVRPTAA